MPVIKSAKKKLRQDKKKQLANQQIKAVVKAALKEAKAHPTEKALQKATSAVDKATKANIMHRNKASRLKSSLSKLLGKKEPKKTETTPVAKPSQKKTVKKK